MNVQKAALATQEFITIPPARHPSGKGKEHASFLLHGIAAGYIEGEKAHRWLGYAQALLVQEGLASLSDMKKANHKS